MCVPVFFNRAAGEKHWHTHTKRERERDGESVCEREREGEEMSFLCVRALREQYFYGF